MLTYVTQLYIPFGLKTVPFTFQERTYENFFDFRQEFFSSLCYQDLKNEMLKKDILDDKNSFDAFFKYTNMTKDFFEKYINKITTSSSYDYEKAKKIMRLVQYNSETDSFREVINILRENNIGNERTAISL